MNKPDLLGNSALHLCVKGGHKDCLVYLLNKNCCNPFSINEQNQTALQLAKLTKSHACVSYLESFLANLETTKNEKFIQNLEVKAEKEYFKIRKRLQYLKFTKTILFNTSLRCRRQKIWHKEQKKLQKSKSAFPNQSLEAKPTKDSSEKHKYFR